MGVSIAGCFGSVGPFAGPGKTIATLTCVATLAKASLDLRLEAMFARRSTFAPSLKPSCDAPTVGRSGRREDLRG